MRTVIAVGAAWAVTQTVAAYHVPMRPVEAVTAALVASLLLPRRTKPCTP